MSAQLVHFHYIALLFYITTGLCLTRISIRITLLCRPLVDYLHLQYTEARSPFLRPSSIGLYRDVWIAAIASSRTTLMGVMCNTSQCELRSLRVNSGMLNLIRIVTYYTLPPLESPDSFWIAMAFSRYRPDLQHAQYCWTLSCWIYTFFLNCERTLCAQTSQNNHGQC